MLYHLYELQHAAVAPARFLADHGQHLLRNPFNPFAYTMPGRALAAGLDLFEQTTRRYGKPKFGLKWTVIDGEEVAVEEEIVCRKTFGQLKHFRRAGGRRGDPRLLIVAPMSGHFATLLRGTVERMLPDHEVYITDWRDARNVPLYEGTFDLDDYVDYVIDFLHFLGPNTHVMAVCQPSVPVLGAVSLMAAAGDGCAPSSMVLMGGPVDTRRSPTVVNRLAETKPLSWFEHNVVTRVPPPNLGMMRRVYPGFLQLAGFLQMNLGRHIDAHWQMFDHLVQGDDESAAAKRDFYQEYRSVMDLTAEFYLQTIKTVFQDHALPRGQWTSRGRAVVPAAIERTALMTVEGEKDDISGLGQTRAAHDLCTSLSPEMRMHYEQKGVGHYGIFNGRKWRDQISPRVKEFIRRHDRRTPA
ncbi:MAG TPA: polyhydroxyalkanoate depolymerase [Alphaproteobacteria bacterium]|nr:polyhydroxyalkanoate depolymerase [Alphaproteobacteria bacterium]